MKKKIFLLGIFLSVTSNVFSQATYKWDNTDVETVTESNVGIGVGMSNIPTDATLKVDNRSEQSAGQYGLPNLKLVRKLKFGFDANYIAPNIIEAIRYDHTFSWSQPISTTRGFVLTQDFNLGIGTDNPLSRLDVHNGDIYLTNSNPQVNRNVIGDANKCVFSIRGSASAVDPYIEMGGSASNVHQGEMNFINSDISNGKFEFLKCNGTSWTSQMVIKNNGKVGIGTSNPTDNLVVRDNFGFEPLAPDYQVIRGHSKDYGLVLYADNHFSNGGGIILNGDNHSNSGAVSFVSGGPMGSPANTDVAFNFMQFNNSLYNSLVAVYKNGKVSIGAPLPAAANNPYDYKLYVKNGILTERVKVALTTTNQWSDFVFDDDYKLRPLSEVEEYINENRHLPEIPSTKEVLRDGLDLAATDAKLLQKVEELTLYVIQQQKEIEQLKTQMRKDRK